jgi:hypothetical protein
MSVKYIPSWVPWFSYEPLAREGKRLSKKMKDDPINFVKNAMVRCHRTPYTLPELTAEQHEGTAIKSLAREHLQEIESLAGSEHHRKEAIVKITLGSIFQGKA